MLRDAYIGEDKISRIYTGEHLVHPSPVRDGLVLWYDFMGRRNSDAKRGIAEDLSGNGNHGTLTNFAYQPGSGYEGDGLRFDGVDDGVESLVNANIYSNDFSVETIFRPNTVNSQDTSGLSLLSFNAFAPLFLILKNSNDFGAWFAGRVVLSKGTIFPHTAYIVTIVRENGLISTYVNNIKSNITFPYSTTIVNGRITIGHNGNRYDYFNGNVFATRLYNRALTPEEIQHNYQLEKERWGL